MSITKLTEMRLVWVDVSFYLTLMVLHWLTDWFDCSWSSSDDNDDPLEAARDSTFVKILQKLVQEGTVLEVCLEVSNGLGLIWDLIWADRWCVKYNIWLSEHEEPYFRTCSELQCKICIYSESVFCVCAHRCFSAVVPSWREGSPAGRWAGESEIKAVLWVPPASQLWALPESSDMISTLCPC